MKYSEASLGRVFVLRLEDSEVIHECIERFAEEKSVSAGIVFLLGGAGRDSKLVVGPDKDYGQVITPIEIFLNRAHEILGVGTLFRNEEGKVVSHVHISAGRKRKVKAGCIRRGVRVWLVVEAVIIEIVGSNARRIKNSETGFELLEP